MSRIPNISKGLGALTPQAWAKIMQAVSWIERFGRLLEGSASRVTEWKALPEVSAFPAVITDWACHQIDPHRYRYSWEMLAPNDKTDLMVSAGATSSGTHVQSMYPRQIYGLKNGGSSSGYGPAYNVPEWGYSDTDLIPPGFDTADSQWPSGSSFQMQPIQKRSMVIMYMMPAEVLNFTQSSETEVSATNLVPCFCLSNIVNGVCP